MSDIDYEDIYKFRGKTRQNLKNRDKNKKKVKKYLENKNSSSSSNYDTTKKEIIIEKNIKTKAKSDKLYGGDAYLQIKKQQREQRQRRSLNKPKNVNNLTLKRQRSSSPPGRPGNSGKNSGKAPCCNWCSPEFSRRISKTFDMKNDLKQEIDQYMYDKDVENEQVIAQQIADKNMYDNYGDNYYSNSKQNCDCKKDKEEVQVEQSDESGTEDQDKMNSESSEISDGFLRVDISDASNDDMKGMTTDEGMIIDKEWEIVDRSDFF